MTTLTGKAYKNLVLTSYPFPVSAIIYAHILAGIFALGFFLIPLLSPKGGKLHVTSGFIYVIAMVVVSFSAILVTPWRMFLDPHRVDSSRAFAYFLFFIAAFALACLQQGLIVFGFKTRQERVGTLKTLGLPIALALVSTCTVMTGFISENWLFVIFGFLAGRSAFKQINFWSKKPVHAKSCWFFHLENIFICCITTVTAFLVTAVPRLFPSTQFDTIWVWLIPTFIMVPWMIVLTVRYEIKFGLRKKR